MSRIGKNPVAVPGGVNVTLTPERITVKGQKGELSLPLTADVTVTREENAIVVQPAGDNRRAKAMWGTTRANIANLVTGCTDGFSRTLEINGVGYRAQVQGSKLVMNLGLSHDVEIEVPAGIEVKAEKPTLLHVSGADKQQVGQFCANIRKWREPEPYKGKGIKYAGEQILRKEGKKK